MGVFMRSLLKALRPDFRRGFFLDVRLWALLVPALVVLGTDVPVLMTLLYSMSAILVVVAMAHTVRRVLMHYLDLEVLARKATETSTGAAVVFLAVLILVSTTVMATALWISR